MITTRRQVLITISQLAAAAALVSCSDSNDLSTTAPTTTENSDLELLASVTYDVLPYPELSAEIYVKAAQHVIDLNSAVIASGLQQLRDAANNIAWKDVAEAKRVAILTTLQGTPFFAELRNNTVQVLLREPDVFKIVGYGGSTIEHGGYINRGFNDINWLPTQEQ